MSKGKGKKSGLSEFRKDALELMVEYLARKFGVNILSVMPESMKDQLLRFLGGPDGEISEQQIYYFSVIPKLLFSGTLSEEAGQSFVRSFGESLRAYSLNPSMDRDARRKDIQRFLDEADKAVETKRPMSITRQVNLFDRISSLPASDSAYMVRFLISLQQGSSPSQYEQFYTAAKKLVIEEENLFLVIQYLKNSEQEMARKELMRVLNDAPLLNPPAEPKKPNPVERFKARLEEELRKISLDRGCEIVDHIVQPTDTVESLAKDHQIEVHTVRSYFKTDNLPKAGERLRIVQGPFSDPIRQIEEFTAGLEKRLE